MDGGGHAGAREFFTVGADFVGAFAAELAFDNFELFLKEVGFLLFVNLLADFGIDTVFEVEELDFAGEGAAEGAVGAGEGSLAENINFDFRSNRKLAGDRVEKLERVGSV